MRGNHFSTGGQDQKSPVRHKRIKYQFFDPNPKFQGSVDPPDPDFPRPWTVVRNHLYGHDRNSEFYSTCSIRIVLFTNYDVLCRLLKSCVMWHSVESIILYYKVSLHNCHMCDSSLTLTFIGLIATEQLTSHYSPVGQPITTVRTFNYCIRE